MSSVDIQHPIFALYNIEQIPRWKTWLLKLLKTKQAVDGDEILYYKYWKGTIYLVKIEKVT